MFNLKRKYYSFIQLKVDKHFVTDSKHIAGDFVNYFETIFNTTCPSVSLSAAIISDFYPLLSSLQLKPLGLLSALDLPNALD